MTAQFSVLARVKKLREDRALGQLRDLRARVREAQGKLADLARQVAASATALRQRDRDLYATILKKPVGLEEVDRVKEQCHAIQRQHQLLVDRADRAEHIVHQLNNELASAHEVYRTTRCARQKFDMVLADLNEAARIDNERRSETEIEDLTRYSAPAT